MSTRFGGKITMRTSSGYVLAGRGTWTVNPTRLSIESVTNDDGSLARVGTNKPAVIEISFEDRNLDLDAILKAPDINFTAVEEFTGVTHLLSAAFVTGDPQINRRNGETTGIKIEGEVYRRLTA